MHTPVLSYNPGIGEAEVEQLKGQGYPGISTNSLPHERKGKKEAWWNTLWRWKLEDQMSFLAS